MNIREFVIAHTQVEPHETGYLYRFSPGNGYEYSLFVLPVTDLAMGVLGGIQYGYLIVNGMTGLAYLFSGHTNMFLMNSYVREKLFPEGYTREVDINCITALLGMAMSRPTNISTLKELGVDKEEE